MDIPQMPMDANMPAPIMPGLSGFSGMPSVIIPQPFILSDPQWKKSLDKIKDNAIEDSEQWETRMTPMFGEWEEFVLSWRVQAAKAANRPKALFNSKSDETHRATETIWTAEFNQLVANDPFFYAESDGLDQFGNEPSEIDLQVSEQTLIKQQQQIRFYEKLARSLRSKALLGTLIVECPWISAPYGDGEKSFEGTDFVHRPLLTTGFNPFVFDLDQSDYIFTLDYPTIVMIRNWAKNNKKDWNLAEIERIYLEQKNYSKASSTDTGKTSTYNRVIQRKQRAGYNVLDNNNLELITRHGRIDTELDVVDAYWKDQGRQDEPSLCDFTAGVLHESGVVRFHATPFRSWHHLFKTAHAKLFEMEPLAYGVGKIGRKKQKELDATESRINDLLMFNVLPMWKIGKYAGVDVSKLTIKPWSFVELENIDQLEPIKANIEAIPYAMNMMALWKDGFRASSGATGTLQGTGGNSGSATGDAIIQNEGMRAVQVGAKITAQVFLRDYLETCHINNTYLMDNGFWVKTMMVNRPIYVDKTVLPANIGFKLKMAIDNGGVQREIQSVLTALQTATSYRNSPTAMNVVEPLWQKLFRLLGEDTRLLTKPLPMHQQMLLNMQAQQHNGNIQGQMTDTQSMQAGAEAGGGTPGGSNGFNSPVGPVSTSPVGSQVSMS